MPLVSRRNWPLPPKRKAIFRPRLNIVLLVVLLNGLPGVATGYDADTDKAGQLASRGVLSSEPDFAGNSRTAVATALGIEDRVNGLIDNAESALSRFISAQLQVSEASLELDDRKSSVAGNDIRNYSRQLREARTWRDMLIGSLLTLLLLWIARRLFTSREIGDDFDHPPGEGLIVQTSSNLSNAAARKKLDRMFEFFKIKKSEKFYNPDPETKDASSFSGEMDVTEFEAPDTTAILRISDVEDDRSDIAACVRGNGYSKNLDTKSIEILSRIDVMLAFHQFDTARDLLETTIEQKPEQIKLKIVLLKVLYKLKAKKDFLATYESIESFMNELEPHDQEKILRLKSTLLCSSNKSTEKENVDASLAEDTKWLEEKIDSYDLTGGVIGASEVEATQARPEAPDPEFDELPEQISILDGVPDGDYSETERENIRRAFAEPRFSIDDNSTGDLSNSNESSHAITHQIAADDTLDINLAPQPEAVRSESEYVAELKELRSSVQSIFRQFERVNERLLHQEQKLDTLSQAFNREAGSWDNRRR